MAGFSCGELYLGFENGWWRLPALRFLRRSAGPADAIGSGEAWDLWFDPGLVRLYSKRIRHPDQIGVRLVGDVLAGTI